MASTSDIKNGLCIKHNHDLFKIIEFLHVKPGKGPAFVRTKLKSLTTGKVLDNTFPSGAKIEAVRVETRKYQYLYPEDTGFHFMHTETFEQIFLEKTIVGGYQFCSPAPRCRGFLPAAFFFHKKHIPGIPDPVLVTN